MQCNAYHIYHIISYHSLIPRTINPVLKHVDLHRQIRYYYPYLPTCLD